LRFLFVKIELYVCRNYIYKKHDKNEPLCQYQKHEYSKPRQARPVLIKPGKKAKQANGWSLSTSVFKGWKDETEKLMNNCFVSDYRKCEYKLKRFIKDKDDLEAVRDILEEHYLDLMNIYKYSCCYEMGEDPYDMQINSIMEFCNTCDIPGHPGSGTSQADLDTIFIATNYTQKKIKNCPDRAVVRFQFLEYVARIALAKYSKPAIPGDDPLEPPLALDKLMESNVLPMGKSLNSLDLRHEFFWTTKFDRLIIDFQKDIDKLFDKYARSITPASFVGMKPALSIEEFVSLLNATKLCKKPKKINVNEDAKKEKKEKKIK